MARDAEQAIAVAQRIGYPVLVRPSFVLGGRAMAIVDDRRALEDYMERHRSFSEERPLLVDKFLDNAIEVDVDALADGKTVVIGGIMEHIEEAGIHSGDSSCSLPPYTLSEGLIAEIADKTRKLALRLGVVGLMNVQWAVKGSRLMILEANPRASRTAPFVSKAVGQPLALALGVALDAGRSHAGVDRQAAEVRAQHPAHARRQAGALAVRRHRAPCPGADVEVFADVVRADLAWLQVTETDAQASGLLVGADGGLVVGERAL
jgi:carbamoyl-phosphate synthase large subunit